MKQIVLCLLFLLSVVATADDEMKTETKSSDGATKAPPLAADGPIKTGPPTQKPPAAADLALRAFVRKKAPFWIDDKSHGAAIRINKDGTFSSEAQGGGSIAGSWKVMKGELNIEWSGGGEKYSYPAANKGGALLFRGKSPSKGRYKLD